MLGLFLVPARLLLRRGRSLLRRRVKLGISVSVAVTGRLKRDETDAHFPDKGLSLEDLAYCSATSVGSNILRTCCQRAPEVCASVGGCIPSPLPVC